MGYNLLINGLYWGYNPLTKLLPTSWDIPVKGKRVVHLRNTKIPLSKERLAVLGGSLSGEFFWTFLDVPSGGMLEIGIAK